MTTQPIECHPKWLMLAMSLQLLNSAIVNFVDKGVYPRGYMPFFIIMFGGIKYAYTKSNFRYKKNKM